MGLIAFIDSVFRDQAIADSPHAFDDEYAFSVIQHDEGINMRMPVFEYEAWMMLLSFPLNMLTRLLVLLASSCTGIVRGRRTLEFWLQLCLMMLQVCPAVWWLRGWLCFLVLEGLGQFRLIF